MSLPLTTLRRYETRVVLGDSFSWASAGPGQGPRSLAPVEFGASHDAVLYLRFWKSDAAAMAKLRGGLYRYLWRPTSRYSDDEVIELLAAYLARGQLVVAAEKANFQPGSLAIPAAAGAGAGAPLAAAALAAPSLPAAPPVPLLPKLEEVQIEGAMVLPEVMQTLEQLELTMGEIDVATVSLEPAPSGLPPIGSALSEASGSITATLDDA